MSAYIVFTRIATLDAAEFGIYEHGVAATLAGHDVKVLAAYGAQEVLEGPSSEGVVIVQFADMQAAKAWYDSPAYRAVRQHRFDGAVYQTVLVQGV